MADLSEQLTATQVITLMDVALGRSPAITPGCATLLVSCIHLLRSQIGCHLGGLYPSPYTRWMDFLTMTRSPEEFEALISGFSTCRCFTKHALALFRTLPKYMHQTSERTSHPVEVLEAMLGDIIQSELLEKLARNLPRVRRGRQHEWPFLPTDFMPTHRSALFI
jgi:hypothetical protein